MPHLPRVDLVLLAQAHANLIERARLSARLSAGSAVEETDGAVLVRMGFRQFAMERTWNAPVRAATDRCAAL